MFHIDNVDDAEKQSSTINSHRRRHKEVSEETDKEEIALVSLNSQEECDYSVAHDGESMPVPKLQFTEYYKQARKNNYIHLKEQFKVS